MAEEVVTFISPEDEEEVRSDKTAAPELFALDCGQLPFERMGDAHFELLVADIYRAEHERDSDTWYDVVSRLNDGADQGRDVILYKKGVPAGVIQCKRLKKNVDLGTVIYEICKFFLYAHIRPQIAPQGGEAFRYYFAAADGVSADTFEFLQAQDQERFDKRVEAFKEACEKVLDKSKTLQKSDLLNKLSPVELCAIVWQRIPSLTTAILKKDSLSALVSKHPSVRNTYFKLETEAGETLKVVREYLGQLQQNLIAADEANLSKIRTVYVSWGLQEGDQLNVCLIQGQELLPFLQGMLNPKSGTLKATFGSRAVVVTAGSSAATPDQWATINGLVEAFPYPLVLLVGCGTVTGQQLSIWRGTDNMSWIDPDWEPAPIQNYRAGWCWVKNEVEGEASCNVLVETAPKDTSLDHGTFSLRLAFKDVIIWPTLGDDFTNSPSNRNSHLRRLIASQSEDKLKRPNLVMASQHIADILDIVTPVNDYHACRLISPIAVALANSGRLQNWEMSLQSATGIFPATENELNTRYTPPGIPASRVMRRSTTAGLTVTLTWDENITLERVRGHRLHAGAVTFDMAPAAVEFHELFHRHPPSDYCVAEVKAQLASFNDLIQQGELKDSQLFAYQTQHGVTAERAFTLEDLASSGKYVMKAVRALSYLKSHDSATWITEPGPKGHLQLSAASDGDCNVLAWANDDYRVRQMTNELYRWARDTTNHPNLIVFANAEGQVKDQKIGESNNDSEERLDITAAPAQRGSITDVSMVNRVYVFPLNEVHSCYDEDEKRAVEDFMDDISIRRKKLDAQ
ncbi:restriction endonuclease [Pseudomonas lurida]|uniref:ABC-three component system protein n=1 Tax=Pseudomonas lurida TaxID=244566 RepID=UPI00177DD072|nr:ABC-three component system protein [Pseudomonas lurida]MBD8666386.1 restriction endonuclease [Pseudomonas lurida]UZQ74776.1 restriction endonuclease [Pseudomonas lurida]